MNKIVFDTNMFYNFLEIRGITVDKSKLSKIIENYDTYLTSVTLVEVIVNFKEDYNVIKKVADMIGREFAYINIGFMPIEDEIINSIKNSRTLAEISHIIDNIQRMKIQKEAEFLRQFLYSILTVISWCIIEINKNHIENTEKIDRVLKYFNANLKGNLNLVLEDYTKLLTKGYEDKKPQKIVKQGFEIDIYMFIRLFSIMYYNAVNNYDIADMSKNSEELFEAVLDEFKNDDLLNNIKAKGNISAVFRKPKYKHIIESTLGDLEDMYSGSWMFKDMDVVLKYFMKKLSKIFFYGAKFKINDISDMLILYSLYAFKSANTIILTHDNDMKAILKESNNKSVEFMDKCL